MVGMAYTFLESGVVSELAFRLWEHKCVFNILEDCVCGRKEFGVENAITYEISLQLIRCIVSSEAQFET